MRETIKSYVEQYRSLPDPLKMFIAAAIFITVGFCIFSGVRQSVQSWRISNLERANSELSVQAQTAFEKQRRAEESAANEALRAKSLEDKLKSLERKEKQTDEKIISSQKTSNQLSRDLERVRVSSPANTGTAELERRLKERYGQTKRSQ